MKKKLVLVWQSFLVVKDAGFSSCGAGAQSGGILPDQGSNPSAPPWQVDSQLLDHQGSPYLLFSSQKPSCVTDEALEAQRD